MLFSGCKYFVSINHARFSFPSDLPPNSEVRARALRVSSSFILHHRSPIFLLRPILHFRMPKPLKPPVDGENWFKLSKYSMRLFGGLQDYLKSEVDRKGSTEETNGDSENEKRMHTSSEEGIVISEDGVVTIVGVPIYELCIPSSISGESFKFYDHLPENVGGTHGSTEETYGDSENKKGMHTGSEEDVATIVGVPISELCIPSSISGESFKFYDHLPENVGGTHGTIQEMNTRDEKNPAYNWIRWLKFQYDRLISNPKLD